MASGKVGTPNWGYTNTSGNSTPFFTNTNHISGLSYDAAGNQTNDGLHSYTFSAENQILSMDGGAATYAYDGDGRRMRKTYNGETTYTFYGPGGIISEFTTSNAIATATAASNTDKCFYHTSDKLGSAVLVMNAAGVVIENNRTLPYGEAWLTESTPTTNDKKFTTYQRDQESGLDYAMNRYDSSAMGRFVSADQGRMHLSRPSTLNRYVYVSNDPINRVDATGREEECFYDICVGVTEPLPSDPYIVQLCGDPDSYYFTYCLGLLWGDILNNAGGGGYGGAAQGGGATGAPGSVTGPDAAVAQAYLWLQYSVFGEVGTGLKGDSDCSSWLQGGFNNLGGAATGLSLQSYIQQLVAQTGVGVLGGGANAVFGATGSNYPIVVSQTGAFYNKLPAGTYVAGGTTFNSQLRGIRGR